MQEFRECVGYGSNRRTVGFCRRYTNVTATDAQLVAIYSQHVPHVRTVHVRTLLDL